MDVVLPLVIVFLCVVFVLLFFFFNDTATTEIYTLSLHDALPISGAVVLANGQARPGTFAIEEGGDAATLQISAGDASLEATDRKSTRLNSSHVEISYAVFCLKKKKKKKKTHTSYHKN